MIVPMKKAVVLTLEKEKDKALDALRSLGVVHLEKGRAQDNSQTLNELQTMMNHLDSALAFLPEPLEQKAITTDQETAEKLVHTILELEKEYKIIEERLLHIGHDLALLKHWDNVDPDDLELLQSKGVFFKLYSIPEKEFKGVPEGNVHILKKRNNFISLLAWADSPDKLPSWEPVELPLHGPVRLKNEKEELKHRLHEIDQELYTYAEQESLLLWFKERLLTELEWEEARLLFKDEDRLIYLSGFVPVDLMEMLKTEAVKRKWGLVLSDPEEDDEVPTKLKVGKVGSLLSPVLDLLGITPGYHEFDVSFFFLSFFTVFAAMLIGDAGYGSIFLLTVLAFTIKAISSGKKVGTGLALLILLSLTTVIWGALNGNWFGSTRAMSISLLEEFRINYFSGDEALVNERVMRISFFLGVVQLGIACIQRFIRELPELKSFSQLGWFAVIVGMYYLVLNQVLGDSSVPFSIIFKIMGAGLIFIVLFGYQEKGTNFFIGVAKAIPNLFTLFLDVVGSFANMMSYIRLFAVGLASLKIAQTFNTMAAPLLDGSFATIGAVFILLLGHSLNIVLALLAVFVHAIRLNVLEYSGQLGMEWSGFKYDPFKVREEVIA